MTAPRRVGLPYGSYPRLLLAYLTTEAVRTKSPKIDLSATPNDLARKLGLSTISGPRGTALRLEVQLRRLLHMRLSWTTSLGLAPSPPHVSTRPDRQT
ncbi:MAG: replication protein RepA [Thermoanaerobaculia bacterium]